MGEFSQFALVPEQGAVPQMEQLDAQMQARIREAMAAVQTAFHKQLDALSEYRFINLESEMDVLSDMLESDGLLAEEKDEAPAQEEADDPFAGLFAREEKK